MLTNKMRFTLLYFPLLCSCACITNSAKILGVFHNPSRSHFMMGNILMEELAKKGHEVTLIGPYRVNTNLSNFEIVQVDGLQLSKDAVIKRVRTAINGTVFQKFRSLQDNYSKLTALFLSHPTFQNILNSNRTYDMVIIDWVFNEAFLGIADHFNAHSVVFSGIGSSSTVNKLTVNAAPSSYVTNIFPAVSDEMTFPQRLLNTVAKIWFEFTEIYQKYVQERLLQEHFPNAPYVGDLYSKVSLVLLNTHFTIEPPRPYVPNMVSIGGFHIPEPRPLDEDLKRFLDEATEGVVYFSLGSIIKSAELQREKIEMLARTFSQLPFKVLWKFESDIVPKLPINVKVSKWLNQSDVLAHPNVKVFVSHGGLLSIVETVYHGVPVVAVPFFGDQEANAEIALSRGYGKKLYFQNLDEGSLSEAITEVVHNPKYRENIEERSHWYKDRSMRPLETAIYWLEYVLRHNGAHHLKTAAVKLSWYQYLLLDVFAFIIGSLVTALIALRALFRLIKVFISKKKLKNAKKFKSS